MTPPKKGTRKYEKYCKKRSKQVTGDKNPFFGKHHSSDAKLRISLSKLNKHPSKETRLKMAVSHTGIKRPDQSERMCGENNPLWQGGISYEPYCPKFNLRFKVRVRARYDYKCAECEKTTKDNGRELDVHHVDFDKKTCCKTGEKVGDRKFVALCMSCHSYATKDPVWAIKHYTQLVDEKHCGKSYLTEEEMANR
jgi:hypothetical protein